MGEITRPLAITNTGRWNIRKRQFANGCKFSGSKLMLVTTETSIHLSAKAKSIEKTAAFVSLESLLKIAMSKVSGMYSMG